MYIRKQNVITMVAILVKFSIENFTTRNPAINEQIPSMTPNRIILMYILPKTVPKPIVDPIIATAVPKFLN